MHFIEKIIVTCLQFSSSGPTWISRQARLTHLVLTVLFMSFRTLNPLITAFVLKITLKRKADLVNENLQKLKIQAYDSN